MIGLLGSLLGSQSGRMVGGMIGGRTGAMIGGLAGSLLGGRQLGKAIGNLRGSGDSAADQDQSSLDINDSQAELLVEVMVNAAKADGSIDEDESEEIVTALGDISEHEKQFLRESFDKPFIDPKQLGSQIDKNLSVDAYVVSLTVTKADSPQEVQYLKNFASALEIEPERLDEVHNELGIPLLSEV